MPDPDWQTWIIETGGEVIEKEVEHGLGSLSPIERLIYCMWVADYGMCNAGDLDTACDVYENFQSEGAQLAVTLKLPITTEAFQLSRQALEASYFERFPSICEELAAANSHSKAIN